MKTSEFIAALAADPVPEPIRLGRRVALALAIGLACSVALYWLLLGPRPDIAAAADTMRFWLKFVNSFAFALPTLLLTLRLARPDAKPRALALWLIAPFILLAAGVIVELLIVPQSEWMSRLFGATAMHCTVTIPMLAAPILAALIVALRAGAPLYPEPDRRNGRSGLGGRRGVGLCVVLPWQFAAVRGDLVSARDAHLHGRRARWPDGAFSPGDGRRTLLLDQRIEDRLQLVDAELSAIDLAVDDEGRRAGHLDLVGRPLADGHDRVGLRFDP